MGEENTRLGGRTLCSSMSLLITYLFTTTASNMNENQQQEHVYPVRRLRNYGAGILVVLLISLGVATIIYANNILPFSPLIIIAWILLPLGVFTCLFAVFAGNDRFYYLIYGVLMVIAGLLVVTSSLILPMTLLGLLLIVLAIIGLAAYWRRK